MHTSDIRPEWVPTLSKVPFAAIFFLAPSFIYIHVQIIYTCSAVGSIPFALNKLSMLNFYLHLVPNSNFRLVCHLSITYVVLVFTALVLVSTFGCWPMSGGWNHDPSFHSTCVTNSIYHYFMTVNNTLTDILLLLLPIPVLLQLRLSVRAKLGLIAMFTMGFMYVPYSPSIPPSLQRAWLLLTV